MLFDRGADAVCDDEEEGEVDAAGDTGAVGDVEVGEVGEQAFQRARRACLLGLGHKLVGGHAVLLLPPVEREGGIDYYTEEVLEEAGSKDGLAGTGWSLPIPSLSGFHMLPAGYVACVAEAPRTALLHTLSTRARRREGRAGLAHDDA